MLNIIFDRDDMKVVHMVNERTLPGILGRSIRLDIRAVDSTKKVYDVEIQRRETGAAPKRARFYSSLMDTELLKAGEDFSKLTETYVIFITEDDFYKEGLPIYHIDR